jgi:mono/diheme cytochrome c family protein
VGLISMSGGAWFGQPGVIAQVREGAIAPAALSGDAARGRYLVERVIMCGECHSARNDAGDIIPETRLRGGAMPARVPWPADWPLQVPRIAGLPGYSDAEALRVLTEGAIKRNGTRARAPMPRFRMSVADASDVIAFLRTQ